MQLPLAYYGHPILRKKAAPVHPIDAALRDLVADMVETMEAHHGCGLAAPQIHRSLALFITRIPVEMDDDTTVPGPVRVFINPKIVAHSPETWACQEGCLSIPGLRETVARPLKVVFQATDLEGRSFEEEFTGFPAHVMMHENDHINGVLFIDRLPPKRKKAIEGFLREAKQRYG